MRGRVTVLVLAVVLALSACAPTAQWLRDRLDTGGGATLDFVEQGVVFDPGPATAFDVHLSLRGEGLALLDSEALCSVTEDARYVDCALGNVNKPTSVSLTGKGVIGSAKYARAPGSLDWQWAYSPIR